MTSNPSPAYIDRVSRVFNGDSTGIRGDLQAVVRAVVTDPEAVSAVNTASTFGKLREPVVRYASLLRMFGAESSDGLIFNSGYFLQRLAKQHPLSAPSVFNFFLPAQSPAGEIAAAGLVAPEFQITTSSSIVGVSNLIDVVVLADVVTDAPQPFAPVSLNFDEYTNLASDIDALVDRLDIVLTAGTSDIATQQAIKGVLVDIDDLDLRARIAIYMFLISSDHAVRL